eukprot:scaffold465_cov383-Pavlova_lutheri.AAC.8
MSLGCIDSKLIGIFSVNGVVGSNTLQKEATQIHAYFSKYRVSPSSTLAEFQSASKKVNDLGAMDSQRNIPCLLSSRLEEPTSHVNMCSCHPPSQSHQVTTPSRGIIDRGEKHSHPISSKPAIAEVWMPS